MNIMTEINRLYELAQNESDETLVKEVIATLENYEYLKSKLPSCTCTDGTMYVEKICTKCGGKERNTKPIMTWNW